MNEFERAFQRVKSKPWDTSLVSFYVVRRNLRSREASYKILPVEVAEDLRRKLRSTVIEVISKSNSVKEYDYHTTDQDDDFLAISESLTDYKGILDEVMSLGGGADTAEEDDLIGSWMYIIRLDLPSGSSPPLFASRKISTSWQTKKISGLANAIFSNNTLIDINNATVFRIEGYVDFFSFDEQIFIAHKKNFESALNFRFGMEKNRDEMITAFKEQNIFSNPEKLKELIGDNMHRLRKLSQVKKSEYYRNSDYMARLREVSNRDGWGIEYTGDGRIIAKDDNIDDLLRFLNNDRLFSQVSDESFDVDAKHAVA